MNDVHAAVAVVGLLGYLSRRTRDEKQGENQRKSGTPTSEFKDSVATHARRYKQNTEG